MLFFLWLVFCALNHKFDAQTLFFFPFSPLPLLSQASEDAKKLVDEERAIARAEIEKARAAVQRVEEALQDHERMSKATGKQVYVIYLTLSLCTHFIIV